MKKSRILVIALLLASTVARGEGIPFRVEPSNNEIKSEGMSCIKGVITDQLTGESLVGATVTILGSDQKVYTDFGGEFLFSGLPAGEYTIRIEYLSYKNMIIRGVNSGSPDLKIQLLKVVLPKPGRPVSSTLPVT